MSVWLGGLQDRKPVDDKFLPREHLDGGKEHTKKTCNASVTALSLVVLDQHLNCASIGFGARVIASVYHIPSRALPAV